MRHTGIVLFLVASAAIQAAETRVAQPEGQTRKTKPGFAKTVATDQAPSKSSPPSAADERDKQVRTTLEGFFAAGTKAWTGREFEAARGEFRRAMAMADAPPHFRSYAHLRIAQSYAAEKNAAAAMAEYGKIKAEAAYPEIHRLEAGECLAELERESQGLPARDPTASRTKVPPVTAFAAEFFVAPDGSDDNPGTREKPFATLEKARDTIRKLKAQGLLGPVGVRLLPGEYRVKSTFELTADDSGTDKAPVVYRADKKGTAVLYGGTRLTGFAPSPIPRS